MSSISTALETLSTYRDVVPVYYFRPAGVWVITGLNKTGNGAVTINDEDGKIIDVFACKRDALQSLSSK